MFWAWAAVLQVLFVGILGAFVSWALLRRDKETQGNVRRFPSRWQRRQRRRRNQRAPKAPLAKLRAKKRHGLVRSRGIGPGPFA